MNQSRVNIGGFATGIVLLLLGVAFLLEELDVWDLNFSVVWPLILIGLGLAIGLGALFRQRST